MIVLRNEAEFQLNAYIIQEYELFKKENVKYYSRLLFQHVENQIINSNNQLKVYGNKDYYINKFNIKDFVQYDNRCLAKIILRH